MNVRKFTDMLREDELNTFNTDLIKEGLIKSWDYKDFIKFLDKSIYVVETPFSLTLKINRKHIDKKFIEKLYSLINRAGFYVANYEIDKNVLRGKGKPNNIVLFGQYDMLVLDINKKFETELAGIPIFMYHVTEDVNLPRIEKYGLTPRSKNKIEEHPERIYLFSDIKSADYYKEDLVNRFKISIDSLITLKIDTRLVNSIKLYFDPKFGDTDFGAFYTLDNIPYYAIVE